MGALILLLLVTTRQIRNEQRLAQRVGAVAPDQAAADPAVNSVTTITATIKDCETGLKALETEHEVIRRRIVELEAQLHDANYVYQAKAKLLQTVRQEIEQLTQEATHGNSEEGTQALVVLLRKSGELQAAQQVAEANLQDLTQRLVDERQKLITLNDQAQQKHQRLYEQRSALLSLKQQALSETQKAQITTGTETILEFTNSSGTSRIPVIVNVTESGFEFLPNGIRLTEQDLQGFPIKDNPLLSAVLTIHKYRSRNSTASEPYVLLLVRPDGSVPFYTAQRIFSESGVHYGYELMENEKNITVETAGEDELKLVRRAVLECLKKRETLYALLRSSMIPSEGNSTSDQPKDNRRMVIRPDGRVVQEDGSGSQTDDGRTTDGRALDGRFYAGGEAPPATLFRPRRIPRGNLVAPSDSANQFKRAEEENIGSPGGNANTPPADQELKEGTGALANADASQPFSSNEIPGPVGASQNGPARSQDNATIQQSPTMVDIENDVSRLMAALQQQSGHSTNSAPVLATDLNPSAEMNGKNPGAMSSSSGTSDQKGAALSEPGDSSQSGSPPATMDLSNIDPKLLGMLKTTEQRSTETSTPVGITVFLDANHVTVGQRLAQVVDPLSLESTFAFLLKSISEDVDAARKSPLQPMLPIVKFIVSPGGERIRIQLARELREIGIPSATVFALDPRVTTMDNVGRVSIDDTKNSDDASVTDLPDSPRRSGVIRLFHQVESTETIQ